MARIPCPLIYDLFKTRTAHDLEGKPHLFDQAVNLPYAEALYDTVLKYKPTKILEVGLACGTSALAMLAALKELNQGGQLISIDPGQTRDWFNCGVANIQRAGYAPMHRLIEDFDYNALPRLLAEGYKPDFAYIDGWHTFDYCLLDFFYIDKMIAPGAIVGFNDCNFRSVFRVLKFIAGHRRYQEFDVGLPKTYASRLVGGSIIKRFEGRSTEDRYFRKVDGWEPECQYYKAF